jgi:AcrR family transcriptional regulator
MLHQPMPIRRKRAQRREKRRRLRRQPEEAKALILDAAKRVFAEKGPDAAGLKDVAREAGVSHGLVTHYYGKYDLLVEAALEDMAQRVVTEVIDELAALEEPAVSDMLDLFLDVMAQPEHGRLIMWAVLSGRAQESDFFARRLRGPKTVADAVEARLRARHPNADIHREEIDWMLIVIMSVGFGLSMGRDFIWDALGRSYADDEREAFRAWLARLVEARLDHVVEGGSEDGGRADD